MQGLGISNLRRIGVIGSISGVPLQCPSSAYLKTDQVETMKPSITEDRSL